jgi:heme A synthase
LRSARAQIIFRTVVVAAVVAAFGQVTLGGVVRVTDSGLGCPDWPLCYGQIIPPFSVPTLIEYSHRLSASVLSLFVAATAALSWLHFRDNPVVLRTSIAALALVIVAAVLGGVTVLTELAWWVVLFHLGIAELLLASLVIAAISGWNGNRAGDSRIATRPGPTTVKLSIAAVVGTFILILSGSYMVGYGAGTSCATWPLCRGSLWPDEAAAYMIHMGHRYVAALVGLVVLAAAWHVIRTLQANPPARLAAVGVIAAFTIQIVVGAAVIWTAFGADFKAVHLSVATLVWASLVTMVGLTYLPQHDTVTKASSLRYQQA